MIGKFKRVVDSFGIRKKGLNSELSYVNGQN